MAAIPATRTCPECGKAARRERDLFPARRRRWAIAAGVLLVAIALAAPWEIEAILHGSLALVPTGVLVRVVPADLPNSAVWEEVNRRVQDVPLTPAQAHALYARMHQLVTREPKTSAARSHLLYELALFDPVEDDPCIDDFVDVLANGSPSDRVRIVSVLAQRTSLPPVLADAIIKLMDDPDPSIRVHAYFFAAAHGPPATAPRIVEMLVKPPNLAHYYAVIRGLAERKGASPELINAALDRLAGKSDYYLNSRLTIFLLRNDPDLREHFPRLCGGLPLSGNDFVRYLQNVRDLRAALRQPRAIALLHDELLAPAAASRLAALKILVALDDETLGEHREALLADPDADVRAEARAVWPAPAVPAAAVSPPNPPARP